MRRVPAALLLLALSLPLIAPLFAFGADESELPACCRRNGKHHCAMNMATMALASVPSRYLVVSEKCPYSPFSHAPLMLPHVFFRPATAFIERAACLADIVREAEAGYRISADRARPKRGPPGTLAA
jgi:hypothetical protein